MKEYWHPDWKTQFNQLGFTDFNSIWTVNLPPIEAPNIGRGGESYVMRMTMPTTSGDQVSIFIKRQINHQRRTLFHPFQGLPTTLIEFNNLMLYQRLQIPSLTPLYVGYRQQNNEHQGLLITLGLDQHQSLDTFHHNISQLSETEFHIIQQVLLQKLAKILSRLHDRHLQHSALYPKHILINNNFNRLDIRIIDLEKSRWRPLKIHCQRRDIECLLRYAEFWNENDKYYFLKQYLPENIDQADFQRFCHILVKRTQKKLAS